MNPLLQAAIGSILRSLLMWLAGFLVSKGVWTSGSAEIYVGAAVATLIGLGWSLWQKYKSRVKFLTALSMPTGTTENDVKEHIASGAVTPTVLTPPDTIPGVPKV